MITDDVFHLDYHGMLAVLEAALAGIPDLSEDETYDLVIDITNRFGMDILPEDALGLAENICKKHHE